MNMNANTDANTKTSGKLSGKLSAKPGGQSFSSVWDAIEATPHAAANMRAKSALLMALQNWLANYAGTQKEAALALEVTQPRLSDLKRGHIDLFSLDTLLNLAESAGLAPTIHVRSKPVRSAVKAPHRVSRLQGLAAA